MGTLQFLIDQCRDCEHLWLDKGELAKLQVIYQYSEKGEEAERFRQRLATMSSQEKADFSIDLDARIKAESNADCTHKCFDPIYCFFFVGCWPVVSTASARSLHEKRSVELINITLIATARYA